MSTVELFEDVPEEALASKMHEGMHPAILIRASVHQFPSIEGSVDNTSGNGACISSIMEVANVWGVVVGIFQDVHNDLLKVSHLRRDGNKGNSPVYG